jgi:preprotein translocase subunit SecG
MYQVIIVIHVLLGLGVIGLVLMQQGKGADAGAAFGTGSSGTVFGAQGAASFLSRSTAILATLFFTTSLGLAILSGNQGGNVYDFMSTPEVEKDTLGIPDVDGAKSINSVPSVPATVKPESITAPASKPAAEQAPSKVTGPEEKKASPEPAPTTIPEKKNTVNNPVAN